MVWSDHVLLSLYPFQDLVDPESRQRSLVGKYRVGAWCGLTVLTCEEESLLVLCTAVHSSGTESVHDWSRKEKKCLYCLQPRVRVSASCMYVVPDGWVVGFEGSIVCVCLEQGIVKGYL